MRANWRRLLLAYLLTNAVLYGMLLPLWEGFDEPFHFGYVQQMANGRGFPDPRSSRLSQEVGVSLEHAPASGSVQRNLPSVTTYEEFFRWPESRRHQVHEQLMRIESILRWRDSRFVNYEALQAPLAYAILAIPERAMASLPLPVRVLVLRILAGVIGALLLFFAAERLARALEIPEPYRYVVIFCTLSSQMIWATLAHVTNDWLSVPLTVWLLVLAIEYDRCPITRNAAYASAVLSVGLLTKAYFLAFVPVPLALCLLRRRWRDLAIVTGILLVLTGPWYLRNVERYGTVSGMQELRQGYAPSAALDGIRLQAVPAAVESYWRSALWTANNTFRAFSVRTLRAVLIAWAAALFLWLRTRYRRAEWVMLMHCGLFFLALAYDTAINHVASHSTSPAPWYTQVLIVPVLALALLGGSRSQRLGPVVAAAMVALFGYVLVVTYWVKLIPLYGGFEGRTSLASVFLLYRDQLPGLVARLNDTCLAPASMILSLAAIVSVLAIVQQAIFIQRLLVRKRAPETADVVQ